jgi:hypothetical protein
MAASAVNEVWHRSARFVAITTAACPEFRALLSFAFQEGFRRARIDPDATLKGNLRSFVLPTHMVAAGASVQAVREKKLGELPFPVMNLIGSEG